MCTKYKNSEPVTGAAKLVIQNVANSLDYIHPIGLILVTVKILTEIGNLLK